MENQLVDVSQCLNPVFFAADQLGFIPDEWQAKVLEWSGKRLLLNCSRQSGKSTITAVLALHHAIYKPASLILLVSPSQRQSSELFRKVVDFRSRLENCPELVEDNQFSMQFENTHSPNPSTGGSRIVSLPS